MRFTPPRRQSVSRLWQSYDQYRRFTPQDPRWQYIYDTARRLGAPDQEAVDLLYALDPQFDVSSIARRP